MNFSSFLSFAKWLSSHFKKRNSFIEYLIPDWTCLYQWFWREVSKNFHYWSLAFTMYFFPWTAFKCVFSFFSLWLQPFEYNIPRTVLFIFILLAVYRCISTNLGIFVTKCADNFICFQTFFHPISYKRRFPDSLQMVLTRFGQWEVLGKDWKGRRRKPGYFCFFSM